MPAGIDGITGTDCLHLEVWWNNTAFAQNGYDIHNVRLYQTVTLPEGRYYFGATYPSAEANDDLYIFASDRKLDTGEIPTQSVAYEKVKQATANGPFRGIFFTLEEETTLLLGFQADFSQVSTNNLRASAVKLLAYHVSDIPSGIVTPHPVTSGDGCRYDLGGRRIGSPFHGLYIQDRKKLIAK